MRCPQCGRTKSDQHFAPQARTSEGRQGGYNPYCIECRRAGRPLTGLAADPFLVYLGRSRDDFTDRGPRAHNRSASRVVGRHLAEFGQRDDLLPGDEGGTLTDGFDKLGGDVFKRWALGGPARIVSRLGASSPTFVAKAAELGVQVVP